VSLNFEKSRWKRVRLGEVVRRSRTQVDPLSSGVERYVAGGHIDSEGMTIERWGHVDDGQMGSTFRYVFRPGQVLFVSARPYLRKVGVPSFAGVVADKTYVLDAIPENGLLHQFLPLVLSSEAFVEYATAEATGSMNPRLLWGPMQRYEFGLPPLDEQERLADLLWAVERHRTALATVAEQVSSAAETRFRNLLGGEWPSVAVPYLVKAGPTNGKSSPANDEGRGVPTLSISAIRDGRVLGGASVKYIDVPPSEVQAFVIEDDDFLVVRGNGNKNSTGKGGLVKGGLPEGCIYPDLLIRLRFDRAKILPEFAAEQWNASSAHSALIQKAKSTNGIWKINGKDIKSHTLITPPLGAQRKILSEMQVFGRASRAIDDDVSRLVDTYTALCRLIFEGNA